MPDTPLYEQEQEGVSVAISKARRLVRLMIPKPQDQRQRPWIHMSPLGARLLAQDLLAAAALLEQETDSPAGTVPAGESRN